LYYAKKNAVEVESYAALFANHSDIIKAISQLLKDFYEIALFQSNKIFNSLLVWAYLIISLLVSFTLVRTKTKVPKLGQIFLLAAIFSFSLIIFSNWSAEMGNPLRYYTYSYILFALGLFLIIDKLSLHLPKVAFLAIILATFSLNASIQFNENYDPGAENRITRPEAELLIKTVKQELPDQESISVIGSYWNSYLIDGLSDNFIAFPREGEYIRDYRNLEKLQENRYFVLISNEWFDPFPEQLTEHQVVLKRLKVYAPIDEIQYALYLNTDWPADKL
jgi:hypothetical protein